MIEVRGFDLRSKEGLRLDEGTTGLLKCGVVDLVGKRSRLLAERKIEPMLEMALAILPFWDELPFRWVTPD